MDITPLVPSDSQVIQGYGDGRFRISGHLHEGAVLVLPKRTLPWPVTAFEEAAIESLAPVLSADPAVEILLFGCGAAMKPLPKALREGLRAAGIVADVMDTGAACRTYNVLLSESRRVAAALLPV